MPWANDPDSRRRDQQKYDAEYRANKRLLIRHHGRVCMKCGSSDRVQCDHIDPDGGSRISNLQLLCISCHGAKTFRQSNAWGGQQHRGDPSPKPTTRW